MWLGLFLGFCGLCVVCAVFLAGYVYGVYRYSRAIIKVQKERQEAFGLAAKEKQRAMRAAINEVIRRNYGEN